MPLSNCYDLGSFQEFSFLISDQGRSREDTFSIIIDDHLLHMIVDDNLNLSFLAIFSVFVSKFPLSPPSSHPLPIFSQDPSSKASKINNLNNKSPIKKASFPTSLPENSKYHKGKYKRIQLSLLYLDFSSFYKFFMEPVFLQGEYDYFLGLVFR